MAGGTIALSGGGIMYGQIVWNSTPNIATNKSRVNASLQVRKSSQYTGTTGTFHGELSIGGNSESDSHYGTVASDWVEVVFLSFDVSHRDDGSGSVSISGSVSGPSGTSLAGKTASGGQTVALDPIPRQASLTGAENFTDEGNPAITYKNKAGNSVSALQACIASEDGSTVYAPYRNIPKTEESYTFQLTEAERNAIRNAIPDDNSMAVSFTLKCTIGADTTYSTVKKTVSIINASPVIAASVVNDAATSSLTGDANKLIRYVSNVQVSSGARSVKGARLTDQQMQNGSRIIQSGSGTFPAVESGEFTFSAEDSRGNTASASIKKSIVEYVRLTCNIGTNAPDTDGNFVFSLSGSYFSGSFGRVSNTLTVEYRFKIGDGAYCNWIAMTPRISGNGYTAEAEFTGLDYQTLYTFQARATDRIGTVSTEETPIKSTPVFDWGEHDFNINGDLTVQMNALFNGVLRVLGGLDVSGGLTVDGRPFNPYEPGSVYISSKSTSPAEIYGGSWVRHKDIFILAAGDKFQAGTSGGEETVALLESHLPPHKHWGVRRLNSDGSGQHQSTGTSASDKASSGYTDSAGGGQPHNNMPPYKAFYVWERIDDGEAVKLTGISVRTQPAKTAYFEGEVFDPAGLTMTATYSDSSNRIVSGPFAFDNSPLTSGSNHIVVSYTENGVTKSANVGITVSAKPVTLSGIAIKTAPTKTAYAVGEAFSTSGMTVEAAYSNGSKKNVTGWTTNPANGFVFGDAGSKDVTVSYSEGGVTKYDMFQVSVSEKTVTLTGITVKTKPDKTTYLVGETFSSAGVVIEATYSDSSKRTVSGWTTNLDGTVFELATYYSCIVSYSEGGVTKTAEFLISVEKAPAASVYYLEYIESTGTQFIDTEIIPNSNSKAVLDFELTSAPSYDAGILGAKQWALKYMKMTAGFAASGTGYYTIYGLRAVARHTATKTLESTIVGGKEAKHNAGCPTESIHICNVNGESMNKAPMKIYSCKIYDGETLVKDYRPCKDGFGVVCLYDEVAKKYVYNAGSGSFVAGPEV